MPGEFINPYNFVTFDDRVQKTPFVDFEKFHDNTYSGQIVCTIKSVGDIPIFIPDAKTQHYAVLLDIGQNKIEERKEEVNYIDRNEYFFKISKHDIEIKETEPVINPDFTNPDELYQSIKKRSEYIKGKLAKIQVDGNGTMEFCIITDDPKSYASKAHKILHFCKGPDGQPIIPSTTIKGMIRNLVEIFSNSCMAFFDDKSVFYRLKPERSNQEEIRDVSQGTYIVTERDETGAKLFLLDAAKINTTFVIEVEIGKGNAYAVITYDPDINGEFTIPLYIKRIGRKDAMEKCVEKFNEYLNQRGRNQECRIVNILSSHMPNIKSKDDFHIELDVTISGIKLSYYEPRLLSKDKKVYALILKKDIRGIFTKYYVKAVHTDLSIVTSLKSSKFKDCEIVQAQIKISDKIDSKTQDMLFFKYGQVDLQNYIDKDAKNTISIDGNVINLYEEILRERKEHLQSQDEPTELRKGNLVYYNLDKKYLSYTQIPRRKYNRSIGEVIGRTACNEINRLCPSCNMFGSTETTENNRSSAISGKISFGIGRILSNEFSLDIGSTGQPGKPLKILSSPKSSCTQFYLMEGDYNNPDSKIRGRKQYYHHHKDQLKYEMVRGDYKDNIIRNNQNVSVELIRDFTFTFKIDFLNLSEYELGLLLFALDLRNKDGQKMYHKIGMGKPLGLGTIEVEIDHNNSFLINRKNRYTGLFNTGHETLDNSKIKVFVDNYKGKQSLIYQGNRTSSSDFYKIPYISDLFHIIEVNTLQSGYPEVKYPRKCERGEPRGFKWFEDELCSQALPTPEEIRDKKSSLKNWE